MSLHHPIVGPDNRSVLIFRWVAFLLAAGFIVRQFVFGDYTSPGGPFRFLTNWGLLLAFFSFSRMLAIAERRSDRNWDVAVASASIANVLVVLMYWRLWFEDPAQVQTNGPLPVHVEFYLHLVGPLLLWIDALFFYGAFRRPFRTAVVLVLLIAAYLSLIELVIAPLNDFPFGTVTTGLPYPFLNNLEFGGRLAFYLQVSVTGLVFLAIFTGLAWAIRRGLQGSFASSAGSPTR